MKINGAVDGARTRQKVGVHGSKRYFIGLNWCRNTPKSDYGRHWLGTPVPKLGTQMRINWL